MKKTKKDNVYVEYFNQPLNFDGEGVKAFGKFFKIISLKSAKVLYEEIFKILSLKNRSNRIDPAKPPKASFDVLQTAFNNLLIKTNKEIDIIEIIKKIFFVNDEIVAAAIYEMMLKTNSFNITTKCKDPAESPEALFSATTLIIKEVVDSRIPDSIDKYLTDNYNYNCSYLRKEQSKKILKIIVTYAKPKTYSPESYADLKETMTLIELHSLDIISKWADTGDFKNGFQKGIYIGEQCARLQGIYMAICILKEIASVRLRPKDLFDMELIKSIIKIENYSILGGLSSINIWKSSLHREVFQSLEGSENIKKRWEPLNKFKEEAKEIAENLWSDDDKVFHHEMAKEIYRSLKMSYPDLIDQYKKKLLKSKKCVDANDSDKNDVAQELTDKFLIKTIRDAIYPVAEKYGRAWGIKGARKK